MTDERVFAGEYRAVRELGSDSAGRTWLTAGPGGEQFVVRVVRPADEAAVDAMERTVAAMSGIRHPALATIHEWGHDAGEFFVVREYVAGVDLKTELAVQGRFAPFTVARSGADVADALEQIHTRGISHGNVATANVLRMPNDDVKLIGGGMGAPWDAVGAVVAPPAAAHYLAPERVDGAGPSPAADVYALGVVLYELLSGHLPFDGQSAAEVADRQLHEAPAPLGQSVPDAPASLGGIILRALEKTPEARWPSAGAMAVELRRVEAEEAPRPFEVEAQPTAKSRRWILALVALVVLAGALGLMWAFGVLPGTGVNVPDVVGKTVGEARSAILAADLRVGDVTYSGVSVAGVADGLVTQQSPVPGVRAKEADRVDLVLAGREMLAVPDVAGSTEAQALAKLKDVGFTVGVVTRVSTTAVEAGIVTSQTPQQGQQAAKAAGVDLWIAQAPVVMPVPDVVGMKQAEASSALVSAGFVVRAVAQASATVAAGKVIEQVPSAGVAAQVGATVTIRVSSGPSQSTVPNVRGRTQAAAVNALSAAGFLTQMTMQSGGGTVGTVVDQSPSGGVKATSGSIVVITVVQ